MLTSEKLTRLNDVTEGRPLFFVHAIEGIGAPLKTLASNLQLPVFCFQNTPDGPTDTIEAMAAYYLQVGKTVTFLLFSPFRKAVQNGFSSLTLGPLE